MKISFIIVFCTLLMAACKSKHKNYQNEFAESDTLAADTMQSNTAPGHICFLHTDGIAGQDSTLVHLIIDGNKISGEMKWLPKEKDGRTGTLEGTQQGNTIKAVWAFMQEGMNDTLAVEFDFPGDKLAQKPFTVNQQTGRQQTDSKAGYTVMYVKVDCR